MILIYTPAINVAFAIRVWQHTIYYLLSVLKGGKELKMAWMIG